MSFQVLSSPWFLPFSSVSSGLFPVTLIRKTQMPLDFCIVQFPYNWGCPCIKCRKKREKEKKHNGNSPHSVWMTEALFLAFLAREKGFSCSSGTASLGLRGKRTGKKLAYFLMISRSQGRSPLGQKKGTPFKGFLVISTIKIVTQATLRPKPGDRG